MNKNKTAGLVVAATRRRARNRFDRHRERSQHREDVVDVGHVDCSEGRP